MAYFAKLDENNIVLEVHAVANEALDSDNEESSGIAFLTELLGYSNWKQTSYNGSIRYNYAGIGYVYDSIRNAFIPPKCHNEATVNESTCQWDCSNADHIPEV